MPEKVLYCAGCNVKYRAKQHDPKKTYKCPKCSQALQAMERSGETSAAGTLDTGGQVKRDREADPLVGQTVAQYQIESKLGEGGMGAVYKAKHTMLGRTVALKILPEKMMEDNPEAVARFQREARAAAVLSHPNLVDSSAT